MEAALIIPVYKQVKYWLKLMHGIEKQTVLPKHVYVMLDRPTPDEEKYVREVCASNDLKNSYKVFAEHKPPEFVGRPNNLPDQKLFMAGYMRNLAIDRAIEDGCRVFIMIDGDCIPEKNLIKAHLEVGSVGIPSLSCGRRNDIKYGWKDQRDVDPKLRKLKLFNSGNGFIIQNQDLLYKSSIVWTCNVGMNFPAVKIIKKLNNKFYGRPEVFSSEFLGTWGGEDGFLGIQANMTRIFINTISEEKSGIRHINHPRPLSKYGDQQFGEYLRMHIELLNEMQLNDPLTIDFFRED
jgi:hypothetical protein